MKTGSFKQGPQFRQCVLRRKSENGTVTTLSWIPDEYARKGKIVKLKDAVGWTDGWKVMFVSLCSFPEDMIATIERQSVNHRKRTDI